MTTKTVLRATQDSFTNNSAADRNYGDKPSLRLWDGEREAYIGFSLKTLPTDAIVQEAFVEVTLRNDWTGSNTITASRITQRWSENRITWNNAPSVSGTNTGTLVVTSGVEGDDVRIDVTAMVSQALAGANWHGIQLVVDTADARNVSSSEDADVGDRPRLVVRFGEEPTPPTNLHPAAAHAVNAEFPVLAWDCDTQGASWVQVATDDTDFDVDTGFVSPDYDDGDWVANDLMLYDLATTSFGGCTDDTTYFWTVKIQDEDGNESEFAEPARFDRHTYGTLVIDSPLDGGTISTDTPTILTTFTGRTLTRIDWTLKAFIPEGIIPGTSGWRTALEGSSFDDDFEINGEALTTRFKLKRDVDLQLIVRAFDEFRRGSVPNETAYVSQVVEFTYADGAPDPVTDLTLTQVTPGSPLILASWERGSAPDEFGIFVNGVLVDRFDSGDASVGGTSYERALWTCQPARLDSDPTNTVLVTAIEDNEFGETATETITPIVQLAWLLAPDDGIAVPIAGKVRGGHAVVETGKTYVPKDGIPRRIVDSTSGLTGKVTGTLVQIDDGSTAADSRDALLAIKGAGPSADVRLVWMRRNISVLLEDIEGLDEWTEPLDELYEVSIPFWELPETP